MSNPLDILLAAIEWTQNPPPDGIAPEERWATHSGILKIGDVSLIVHQLNTGERIIDGDDLARFFGGGE